MRDGRPLSAAPPRRAKRSAYRRPALREFLHNEASGAILLLACAFVALVWANSAWADTYGDLWTTKLTIGIGRFHLTHTLQHWINDGLMTIFFFVVGLEIKRELLVGELASPRRAALPAVAALGGVLVPAAIYALLNAGTNGSEGWAIPMATDIAFALGVLALLGDRIPLALKVFLTALAIVDDIGAVLVIALFYTSEVSLVALGMTAAVLAVLVGANRLHLRYPMVYLVGGAGLWLTMLESGVHATVAGVLLAFTIPARARTDTGERAGEPEATLHRGDGRLDAQAGVERHGPEPLQRLEHALHPWVAFAIVPLFALANAGVQIGGDLGPALGNRVTLGVVLGLVVGKQVGITLFAFLGSRVGMAMLPTGVTWRQVYGVSWLAGIGFTMSLFVTDLAFAQLGEEMLLRSAKLGILAASLLSGIVGWYVLVRTNRFNGEQACDDEPFSYAWVMPDPRPLPDDQLAAIAWADDTVSTGALAASLGRSDARVAAIRRRIQRAGHWSSPLTWRTCLVCGEPVASGPPPHNRLMHSPCAKRWATARVQPSASTGRQDGDAPERR